MTKHLFVGALACTVALAAVGVIEAGERQRKLVAISDFDGGVVASGNAGDVFNSQDRIETIWCRVSGVKDYNFAMCFARDSKGRTLQCATDNDDVIKPMLAINGDSTIQFFLFDRIAHCGNVTVVNGSYAAPKRQTTPEDAVEPIDTTGEIDEVQP